MTHSRRRLSSIRSISLLLVLGCASACSEDAAPVDLGDSTGDPANKSTGSSTNTDSTGDVPEPDGSDESTTADATSTGVSGETDDPDEPVDHEPVLFELLIQREGLTDFTEEWLVYRAFEDGAEGPALAHEDVEGRYWHDASVLSERRVVYRTFDSETEEAQVRLGNLVGEALGETIEVDSADRGFIVSPHDEAILYVRDGLLYRQELEGPKLGERDDISLVSTAPGPFPAVADPQGRYVVAMLAAGPSGVPQLGRVSLSDGAQNSFTDVGVTGSVNLPSLSATGDDGFFVRRTDSETAQLMQVDLESGDAVIQPLAALQSDTNPLVNGGLRPHADAPGVVAVLGPFGDQRLEYFGIDASGDSTGPVPLHGPEVTTRNGALTPDAWSPDGRWLVYEVALGLFTRQAMLADFGDGHAPSVTSLGLPSDILSGHRFTWSSDSETLYFAEPSPATDVWTLEAIDLADGGPQSRASVELPYATPLFQDERDDGAELLLTGELAGVEGRKLFSLDVSRRGWGLSRQLDNGLEGEVVVFPSYSPDEQFIAYGLKTGPFGSGLSVMVAPTERPEAALEVIAGLRSNILRPSWAFVPQR